MKQMKETYLTILSWPFFCGSGPPIKTLMCIPTASPMIWMTGPNRFGRLSKTLFVIVKIEPIQGKRTTYFWASAGANNPDVAELSFMAVFLAECTLFTFLSHWCCVSSSSSFQRTNLKSFHAAVRSDFSWPLAANSALNWSLNEGKCSFPQTSQPAVCLDNELFCPRSCFTRAETGSLSPLWVRGSDVVHLQWYSYQWYRD